MSTTASSSSSSSSTTTTTTAAAAASSSNDFYTARTLKHIARQVHQFMRKYGDLDQHQHQHQQKKKKTTASRDQHTSSSSDMWLLPQHLSSSSDLHEVHAALCGPCGTPYEGGVFHVRLHFPPDYPQQPPRGAFLTRLFHPNVSPQTGDICVDTLKRGWDPATTLERILLVVRCLLIEPNPDSALNAEAGRLIQEDFHQFAQRARMFTRIYAAPGGCNGSSSGSEEGDNKENHGGSTHSRPPPSSSQQQQQQSQRALAVPGSNSRGPPGRGIKASAKVTAATAPRKKTSLKRL